VGVISKTRARIRTLKKKKKDRILEKLMNVALFLKYYVPKLYGKVYCQNLIIVPLMTDFKKTGQAAKGSRQPQSPSPKTVFL
jgi:hypothetical protein